MRVYFDPASIHAEFHRRGLVPDNAVCRLATANEPDAFAYIYWNDASVTVRRELPPSDSPGVLAGDTEYFDYHGQRVGVYQWFPADSFTRCAECGYLTAPRGRSYHADNCPARSTGGA